MGGPQPGEAIRPRIVRHSQAAAAREMAIATAFWRNWDTGPILRRRGCEQTVDRVIRFWKRRPPPSKACTFWGVSRVGNDLR